MSDEEKKQHAAHLEDIQTYRWLILLGLITAAIMEVLDTTIVNVALPQMAGNLGATNQEIGWVATGYILSNVVVLPMTAFLAARFGRKNYLTFSIILFITASFFCGTSHSLVELVMWRVLQGAGGAALLSTAQATIRQIFPREQQGVVQAIFIMGIIVAPTLGPTLGGWITDNYTWNWCFFINVPIGIIATFLVTSFLHDPPGARVRNTIDWTGIGLLAIGLGSLQYVLEEGQQNDWFQDATIVRLSFVALVCLGIFLWWQLTPRNRHPVVDFHVLKNRSLAASIALFVALGFGLYGGVFIFPLFTQSILRFTPTDTGLALLPGGIATAVAAIGCGRLLNGPKPLVDPRVLIYLGVAIFCVSMWQLGHLTTVSGMDDTRWPLIIRGFGLGCLFTPINQVAYGNIDPRIAQQAAGLMNLARQLGGSFGIAALGTFVSAHATMHRADLTQYIYPSNPAVALRMQAMTSGLMARGLDATTAHQGALKLLDSTITVQSLTKSYDDAFMLILGTFLLTSPAILILRRPGAAKQPAEAH
ncbi:MAG TPA: DHA2 family efflux MFS transporter permease subunit [Fimbriimonadaceae bacterium]|nr:DHA2 family efflux MFS transporter permease subunit [Fimbriimonadaceae bacterium]